MTKVILGLSADIVAAALVRAAREQGINPARVFERGLHGASKARTLAGAAVLSVMSRKPRDGATIAASALFAVAAQNFAPSNMARDGLTVDQLLDVVEAMRARGLDPAALSIGSSTRKPHASIPTNPSPTPFKRQAAGQAAQRAKADAAPAPRTPLTVLPARPAARDNDPTRQDDVRYTKGVAAPLDLGDRDAELVAATNRQGGFPTAAVIAGKPVWLDAQGENWRHRP